MVCEENFDMQLLTSPKINFARHHNSQHFLFDFIKNQYEIDEKALQIHKHI